MKIADRIILNLFFLYVFMLPFENIQEVAWGIDTPYRAYRILALFIGFLILTTRKIRVIKFYKNDLKLLWVYLFGLLPSAIAWADNRLLAEYFWLTSLQYFIVLWILLLIKNLPFEIRHAYTCMNLYGIGVLINCLFMIYNFIFTDIGRQSGWMDNANFAAFANNIAFAYFFYLFYIKEGSMLSISRILLLIASFITLIGLFVTGSRSSLISLSMSILIIIFYKANFRKALLNLAMMLFPVFIFFQFVDFNKFITKAPLWDRLISLNNSEDPRRVLWTQGLEAFKDTYFIGLGIEQFKNPENYRKYVHKSENVSAANQDGLVLHNDYLTVLFEFGILSFIMFIGFYYGLYNRLKIQIQINPKLFVFLVCFINMVLFSMFDSSFQSHSMWFVYIILGIVAYMVPVPKQNLDFNK
ncbi:MAG: O-antigen ligase family protein [Saprospiraceae bacterium]|nr:O-antigen ligase family protein [Saprospiraceae bacterium]